MCEQLAQGRYLRAARPGVEFVTSEVASQRLNHYATRPHTCVWELANWGSPFIVKMAGKMKVAMIHMVAGRSLQAINLVG